MVVPSIRVLTMILSGALLAACGSGGSGTAGPEAASLASTGTVTLALSDGVIEDYDQVLMEVAEIRFLGAAGQDIVVLEDPVAVDFLALQNFSEVLMRREVAVGTYGKIRLILNSLTLVDLDDTGAVVAEETVPLNGLRKIDLNPQGPFTVRAGQDLVIDIEIDLDKAIHVVRTGHSDRIRFRPVIFAAIDAVGPFDKLFRVEGRVDSIDDPEGTFTLCDIRRAFSDDINRPQPAEVCVTVDPDPATPYFDAAANRLESDGFADLMEGDNVVVYGKFDYDANVPADSVTGDWLIPAVVANGLQFEDAKGLAASEYRPATVDFDLGPSSATCGIDPNTLRVVVADGAPAFIERPASEENPLPVTEAVDDLAELALLCRRAEVEGYYDYDGSDGVTQLLRSFIVLLGDSPLGDVELVGTLTADTDPPEVEDDYDLDVLDDPAEPDPTLNDELVVVTALTRIVAIESGVDGDVVQSLDAVPAGKEVSVYGVRRDDGVIEASFILVEEEATP